MRGDEHFTRIDPRQLQRRVQSMIVRGVVSNVDDALKLQALGLDLEDRHSPTEVEHIHPYGISYHPKKDAEVIVLSLGGNRDHMIVLPAFDRRFRLTGLAEGEFAIHDDQGQKVHFKRDKTLIETSKDVEVKTSQKVTVDASQNIALKTPMKCIVECPDIRLGDPDASARVLLETGPAQKIRGV